MKTIENASQDKIATSGFTVSSTVNPKWTLTWEDCGEGYCGEYDPENPEDVPYFRVYLSANGHDVDDGSYCTSAVIGKATEKRLSDLSHALFAALGSTFSKKTMETWTWSTGK